MLNIHSLSLRELQARKSFRCVHYHNGLSHSSCYDQAHGLVERIGYFDIESSSLTSDFGTVLVYCIKHETGILTNKISPYEIANGIYDRRLLSELCVDLRKFDRIITWYGAKFDIPFVRSRCILHGHNFPLRGEILHTDAYLYAKHLLRTLHSKRLGEVAKFYGIAAKEHPLNPTVWLRCLSGNQKAIDYTMTHCKEDVIALEKVCKKTIFPYIKFSKTSI
jgi:uncharacterized protein YprB with RNaseH-like and TPR domain